MKQSLMSSTMQENVRLMPALLHKRNATTSDEIFDIIAYVTVQQLWELIKGFQGHCVRNECIV